MENKDIKEILSDFDSGNFNVAEKKAITLLQKFPDNFILYNMLGVISASQKKYNEAIEYFKKTIQINPNSAQAYYNLGKVLSAIEQYRESISNYAQAIKIKPNYADAYYNLGNVFRTLNDFQKAIDCYEKTIEINYDYPDAYNKLAILYCDIGKVDDARKRFKELIKLEPDNVIYKINSALLLTPIYKSVKEINLYRSKFLEGIDQLKKYKYPTNQPANEIELNFYYLAYHNKDNLEIMKKLCKLFRKIIPNINYVAKNITNKKNEKKIRIGFISQHLTNHTVGKIFGGLIKNINKEKFDVTIFHTLNTKKGSIKNEIDASANKVVNLKSKIHEQQLQIENENLDIIFYPDIGMSPVTYFLAFSRLAPVQITSWGHSETTGIDTIDYFLSTKLFEGNNGNKRYSEKLICLSQIPTYFEPPQNIGSLKKRSELSLPKKSRLYGCPQALFKLHPDFDRVFSEILKKDNDGYIVLIGNEGKDKFWSEILKKRWSKNFPILNKKVLFTKRLSLLEFFSLSNCVDVLLIPLHFGGGNTSIEAMMFGTPSITKSGNHLRTNVTAAIYKQMKISNPPIVKSTEEYIKLAIKLAKDRKKNNFLREKLKKAANKYLFKNHKALQEFENFLEKTYREIK